MPYVQVIWQAKALQVSTKGHFLDSYQKSAVQRYDAKFFISERNLFNTLKSSLSDIALDGNVYDKLYKIGNMSAPFKPMYNTFNGFESDFIPPSLSKFGEDYLLKIGENLSLKLNELFTSHINTYDELKQRLIEGGMDKKFISCLPQLNSIIEKQTGRSFDVFKSSPTENKLKNAINSYEKSFFF